MPFFPVDDDAAHHAKIQAAGNAAVGLWARAGAHCMKQATSGVIERHALTPIGTVGQAKKLVEVGLWHAHGHGCDRCPQPPARGWIFHDWTDVGKLKTGDAIKAERAAARDRMRRRRSSEQTGARSEHVRPNTSRTFGTSSATPSPPPEVVDVSSRPTVVTGHGIDDDGLDRISHVTGGGRDHASLVARQVLEKAPADVRDPLRYVMAAVTGKDRPVYRHTPRLTPDRECPKHPGEWAAHCRCCASERLAGGGA